MKPNSNQNEFKVYFILSTEAGKIDPKNFYIDKKGFGNFVCEKIFPIINNKFEPKIFSSTYDKNIMKDKEITIFYTKNNNSEKYILNTNDNYFFNVKLKYNGIMNYFSNCPEQQPLLENTQYKYYLDFLKENNLQTTYTKRNLNRDIVKVMNNSKTIEFTLFLNVFKETFNMDFVKQLLVLFKEEKIYIKDKIPPNSHHAVIKLVYKNTNKVLSLILGNKKKKFGEKLYLIIIYYYYYVIPQNFLSIFEERKKKYKDEKDEFEIDLVDLFFQNEKMFKPLDDSNIINMIKYVDSYEKLMCLLKKISSFSNWIKAIEINKELIMKILISKKTFLKLKDCSSQPEKNKLDEILDNIYKIKEFSINKQYEILQLPFNFFQMVFLPNCINNTENLDKLKKIFKRMDNLPQRIIEEIEEKEHNLYERQIKESKLMNVEMFEKLRKDPYYQKLKFNPNIKINFILEHINFQKIKNDDINQFLNLFNQFNFKELLPSQLYDDLIIGLINKIQIFEDFELIFKIIDFSNEKILKSFQNKFMRILYGNKDKYVIIELYTIQYISLLLKFNYIDYIKEIISKINKTIDLKIFKNIMLKTINQLTIKEEDLALYIIKFLNDLKGINLEMILFLLKNNNNLIFLIERLNSFILKYDDFYKNDSENLKIFINLKTSKIFDKNELIDTNYIKETKIIYEQIKNDLANFNISYNYYEPIKKLDNLFKERIIFLFEQKQGEELYNKIILKINTILESKNILKEIIKFLNNYFESPEKIPIIDLERKLEKIKLFEYHIYENEINKYKNEYLNLINQYNKFNSSNFFKIIFEFTKGENFEKQLQNTEDIFQSLINLFDQKNFNKINKDIFDLILKSINSKEYLENEINFLKKYFKKNEDTQTIESILVLISSKDNLITSFKGIEILFNEFNIKKTEFSKIINSKFRELKEKSSVEQLLDIITVFKELNIDIIEDSFLMILLNQLTNKKDLIPFIKHKDSENIKILYQFINDDDKNIIQIFVIDDFIKCIEFISELKKFSFLDDKEFFYKLQKLMKDDKFKNIILCIQNMNKNFKNIKELYTKNIDESEYINQIIKDIYSNSQFLIQNQEGFYNCIVKIIEQEENLNLVSYENLLEIRDKILVERKDEDDKNKFSQLNQKFITLINNIDILFHLIIELSNRGYPKDMKYQIIIKNGYATIEQNNINKTIQNIQNLLNKQNSFQIQYYLKNPLIRLIYGKQFYLFHNFLRFASGDLKYLLQYITNNNYKNIKYDFIKSNDSIKDSLENTNLFLNKLFNENNISQEVIFKNNILKNPDNKGLKSIFSLKNEIDINTIKIFLLLTGNLPLPQTLLICNEETTSEEIIAFFYRAILCEYNVLFVIMKIENLEEKINETILDILNNIFIQNKNNMNSCLLFIYNDENNKIIKEIKEINGNNILDINLNNEIKLDDNTIEVIYSDDSGVGKSTLIKDEIKNDNKKFIYFPIGGDITREEIIKRLQSLEINENTIIHLDLVDTFKTLLINEFLFYFLITKYYSNKGNIFYLGNKINIKIELPYRFIDFRIEFPILNLFKQRLISIQKLPLLKISNEFTSNIQIVCNYLKFFKENKINDYNIYIKGLTNLDSPNKLNIEILEQQTCEELLNEFLGIKLNYYQKLCFIDSIVYQLILFSNNFNIEVNQLKMIGQRKNQDNLYKMRSFIINSLIQNIKHFSIDNKYNLIQYQEFNQNIQNGKYDEDKELQEAIQKLENKEYISYNKIKPSLVFCNLDGESLSILTNYKKGEEEYNDLTKLYSSNINEMKDLIDYQNPLNSNILFEELIKILNLNTTIENVKEILGNYVFISDNFIKIILIIMRIQTNIPIIIMGESGCGKSSLIKILSKLVKSEMKTLNIHSEITDKDIFNFMEGKTNDNNINLVEDINEEQNNKFLIDEMNKLIEEIENTTKLPEETEEEFEKRKEEYKKQIENEINNRKEERELKKKCFNIKDKIWIFLDGINTCNSMGLINEMICNHTMNGRNINKKVTFIACCNPYETLIEKKEIVDLINVNEQKIKNLKYNVNPIPYSLLNFVLDFGNLTSEDEIRYIKNIVERIFIKMKNKDEITEEEFKFGYELSTKAIIFSQNFIREKNEINSVSLREIKYFTIFFNFFNDYFINKSKDENPEVRDSIINLSKKEFLDQIINLSIFICYYIRISNKNTRNNYLREIEKIFGHNFEEIPLREEEYVASNINIEKGISKNKALLVNLFTLFVCVNTQVPIFIFGKPGSSKSLCIQLLFKSMKGEKSENQFFRNLPKLIIYPYQCSKINISKGVLKMFNKVRDIVKNIKKRNEEYKMKDIKEEKVVSMIYFDGMELIELSSNNILNIINSQLEYDENNDNFAFVGISNCIPEKNEINKGIYLVIPEPDEKDLQKTALTIAESYDKDLCNNNTNFFQILGSTYYHYKVILNQKNQLKDFHSLRDFYNCIKNGINLIKESNNEINENILIQIGLNVLERNFDGIERLEDTKNSIDVIQNIFKNNYKNIKLKDVYETIENIKKNIKDKEGRHLLIINKNSNCSYLIENLLNEMKKEHIYYLKTQFEINQIEKFNSNQILNKIISIMKEDEVLLLKDLESIYPNLYNLFKQDYTIISDKKYTSISFESSNNSLSFVHNDFKCIILMDENEIEKEERFPFFNLFEKHFLSFEYLLEKEIRDKIDNILLMLYNIIKLSYNISPKYKYDLEKQLINCNKDELLGIAYFVKNKNINEIEDEILKKIVPTFSQDIMIATKVSSFDKENPDFIKKIFKYYGKEEHSNLSNFLENTDKQMNIIYTFSSISENINIINKNGNNIIKNEKFNLIIKTESIVRIIVSKLKSVNDLDKDLLNFDENNNVNICIIEFQPFDTIKMNSIKLYIEKYIKDNPNMKELKKILFVFMIHLFRIERKNLNDEKQLNEKIIDENNLISHLSTFNQVFIDNINGLNISILDILEKTNKEIFDIKQLIDLEKEIKDYIYILFSSLKYDIKNKLDNFNNDDYRKRIMENIITNNKLKDKINLVFYKEIDKIDNILFLIFKNPDIVKKDIDIDFISIIKYFQKYTIQNILTKVIIKCEKEQIISFLLNNENINDEFLKTCFDIYFEQFELEEEEVKFEIENNKIQILLGINIPGIIQIYEKIILFINDLKEEFILNEEKIKNKINEEEELKNLSTDFQNKQENLINKIVNEFKKYKLFKLFDEMEKEKKLGKYIDKIYQDYFTLFLGKKFDNINYSKLYLLLNILIEKKYGEKKEDFIKYLSKSIIWLELNSNNIFEIFSTLYKIKEYKDNINEFIINIFEDKKINLLSKSNINYNLIGTEIIDIFFQEKKEIKKYYPNFINKNHSIIEDFCSKYESSLLSKDEQNILIEYSNQNEIDYYKFMQSLQLIIFYLINNNYQSHFSIHGIIKSLPDFIQINENCKEFFNQYQNLKLEQLIPIFEYFELKSFPQIIKNINIKYKKKIDNTQIDNINLYFKNEELILINKTLLSTSVRKFISRYLNEKKEEDVIQGNENLLHLIQIKREFWDKDIISNSKFNEEFNQMINTFEITSEQAINFYRILNGKMSLKNNWSFNNYNK